MLMPPEVYLNVAKTLSHSRANGPGVRAVVWVQGCTIGCDGCYSPHSHPHKRVNLVDPEDLAAWICDLEGIEGVTVSGGEPFEQADGVLALVNAVRLKRPDLTWFLFTGFTHDALKASAHQAVQTLLESADMLSSGPFVPEKHEDGLLWRGSVNQVLVYLTNRYTQDQEYEWSLESPVEEMLLHHNRLEYTGFKAKNGVLYNTLRAL
jgi:anaerobic ribonucleoside-triphosphate reductase activating protein